MRTTPGRLGGRGGRSGPPRGRGVAAGTSPSARRTPPGARSPRSSPPGRDSPRRNSTRFCTGRTPPGRWRRPRRVPARRRRPPPTAGAGGSPPRSCSRVSPSTSPRRPSPRRDPPAAAARAAPGLPGRGVPSTEAQSRRPPPRRARARRGPDPPPSPTPRVSRASRRRPRGVAYARPIASPTRRAGGSPLTSRGVARGVRASGSSEEALASAVGRRTGMAGYPSRGYGPQNPERRLLIGQSQFSPNQIAPSSDRRWHRVVAWRTDSVQTGEKSAGRATHAPPTTRFPRRQIHLGRPRPHPNAARASQVRHRSTVARFPALSRRATFSAYSEGAEKKGFGDSPSGRDVSRGGSRSRRSRAAGNRARRRKLRRVSRALDRDSRPIPPPRARASSADRPDYRCSAESEQQRPLGRISSASRARRAAPRRVLGPPPPSLGEIAHV